MIRLPRIRTSPAAPRLLAWAAAAAIAVVSRVHGLGDRAMSHDESLHAWYSWVFATHGVYAHDPMMHGPLLFHTDGLVFRVLGDTDTTARLAPALAGLALAGGLLFFRRWLGPAGARVAAALALASPVLLFYSRYLRNDVYMALFALPWVYGLLRYLERPAWIWLAVMTAGMALSFVCKETAFITGAIFGGWLIAAPLAAARRRRLAAPPGGHPPAPAPPPGDLRLDGPAGDLAVFMLAVSLPFASALGHLAMGWDPRDWGTPEGQSRALLMQAAFAVAAAGGAILWLRARRRGARRGTRPPARWWAACAAGFWAVQALLYTSVFTNVRAGLASGITGSLGYWLAQHDVGRAGQPWFYYLMLALLYEFLPLALAAAAAVRLLARRREPAPWPAGFFAAWTLAAFALYSLSGEKMPWLLANLALPAILLGATWAGGFLERLSADLRERAAPALLALAPLAAIAALNLPDAALAGDSPLDGARDATRTVRVLAAAAALGAAAWRLRRSTPPPAAARRRLAGAGALLVLAWLSARTAYRLAFVNQDLATEPLVYAHAGPAVKEAARRAAELQRTAADADGPVVAYDGENTWPMIWYFRHVRARPFGERVTPEALRAPLIVCGDRLAGEVRESTGGRRRELVQPALWWPVEDYKRGLAANARLLAADPDARRRFWRIVAFREYPGVTLEEWPLRRDAHLFFEDEAANSPHADRRAK